MEKLDTTSRRVWYRYLLVSSFLVFLLLSMTVAIKSQELTTDTHAVESPSNENSFTLTVINEYFEIFAVLLEVGIVILLWKTVKDFAELAKVSKLQTEVRFRPWVGPTGGFEFLREDDDKKQYSIALKNFGEVPASDVIVTSIISDTKPDKSSAMDDSNSDHNNKFHQGPLLPGMEKRYWIFIENQKYRKAIDGTSDIFIFIYFSYVFSSGQSAYGMISQLDSKTNNFVHREMWID